MPEMAEEKVDKILNTINKLPGYIFELTANLGSERNFSIRGNFASDVSIEVLNAELDKLVKATDRQLSRACVPNIEDEIVKLEDQLKLTELNLKQVEKKGERFKGTPQQMQIEVDNATTNIEQLKANIQRKKNFLENTRKDAA